MTPQNPRPPEETRSAWDDKPGLKGLVTQAYINYGIDPSSDPKLYFGGIEEYLEPALKLVEATSSGVEIDAAAVALQAVALHEEAYGA